MPTVYRIADQNSDAEDAGSPHRFACEDRVLRVPDLEEVVNRIRTRDDDAANPTQGSVAKLNEVSSAPKLYLVP